MFITIISLLSSLVIIICGVKVANSYSLKFKEAKERMRCNQVHGYNLQCDSLDYWRYLLASLLFKVLTAIVVLTTYYKLVDIFK